MLYLETAHFCGRFLYVPVEFFIDETIAVTVQSIGAKQAFSFRNGEIAMDVIK